MAPEMHSHLLIIMASCDGSSPGLDILIMMKKLSYFYGTNKKVKMQDAQDWGATQSATIASLYLISGLARSILTSISNRLSDIEVGE